MKKLSLICGIFITQLAMGQVFNTAWQYNSAKCMAQTVCPDGRMITCSTVGFNYGNAPRIPQNMCRSRVIPGRFVHCQGFADNIGPYGRVVFTPANYPVSCY